MFSLVQHQREQVKPSVEQIPKDKLLSASEEDLIAALTEDLQFDVPVISDEPTVETQESKADVSRDPMRFIDDPSRPYYVPSTMVVVSIPFTGDAGSFAFNRAHFPLIRRVGRLSVTNCNSSTTIPTRMPRKLSDSISLIFNRYNPASGRCRRRRNSSIGNCQV